MAPSNSVQTKNILATLAIRFFWFELKELLSSNSNTKLMWLFGFIKLYKACSSEGVRHGNGTSCMFKKVSRVV